MQQPLGVGILGFGLAARIFHAPFVSAVAGLALRAVVERHGSSAVAAYPAIVPLQSAEALLELPGIDIVIVATPNSTHATYARQALLAGKHVVVDKPFAATSQEADELIALAEARGLILAPFHNRRWDGDFLTVQELIRDGRLGRLVRFDAAWDRYRPLPRTGSWKEAPGDPTNGLLFDLGPHLLDQALALFGMPASFTASIRSERAGSGIEDAFDLTLHYPPALEVRLGATMLAAESRPRFLLCGSSGSYLKHGVDPQEPAIAAGRTVPPETDRSWLEEEPSAWGTLTLAPDPARPGELDRSALPTRRGDYRRFYANLRDAIRGVAPLAVPPQAGRDVIRLLELARLSHATQRDVCVPANE